MCVLNGRLNPIRDSFTSISHRGKAVVNYIAVQNDQFCHYDDFQVLTASEMLRKFNLIDQGITRISDHSLLLVKLRYFDSSILNKEVNVEASEQSVQSSRS